ncbi:hypothetical protein [Thalassomonas sp. RHCl1]|uniref:hypothetical protein n=1 Tax=Thalassomonas sp. RHCl1 TaxID=2995320 RepID=UPI00248B4FDC|nr:hypothetical protein [Thalassomonas sp. RHCl1]
MTKPTLTLSQQRNHTARLSKKILKTNDLKMITGGSGIHNGDDPAAPTVVTPVADRQTVKPVNG